MRALGIMAVMTLCAAPAFANCDVDITIRNTSEWTISVPLDRARLRTRIGTWHRMWPDAADIDLAAGEDWTGTYEMRACAWNAFHRFEIAIHREPNCTFQGETRTTTVLGGGGGSNRPSRDADLITAYWPAQGFVRNDHLDPDPGRPPYRRNQLSVQFSQPAEMCRAARGE